jgi:tocopherol O-methyltransferase
MSESPFSARDVAAYYDRSTPAFVTLGQGAGAIRRAVWGPGVRDRAAAFRYVDDRLAEIVAKVAEPLLRAPGGEPVHVVDLGCGVGTSLRYLAERLPLRGTGITVSPLQAQLAAEHARASGLAGRVTFVEGDFCHLPPHLKADVAFAIEAFVHAASARAFFAQCRELVRPGGVLAICDDFARPTHDSRAPALLDRFRRGWHVNSLIDARELHTLAAEAGFAHEATQDLSPYLELHRPRDRAVNVFLALFGWLPLQRTPLGHLVGGSALQTCLTRGWIGYDLAVFRRTETA